MSHEHPTAQRKTENESAHTESFQRAYYLLLLKSESVSSTQALTPARPCGDGPGIYLQNCTGLDRSIRSSVFEAVEFGLLAIELEFVRDKHPPFHTDFQTDFLRRKVSPKVTQFSSVRRIRSGEIYLRHSSVN